MKKYIPLLLFSVIVFSCQYNVQSETATENSSTLPLIGGVRDKNGCLVTAGYTWSKIKKECIRPWEATIFMNITDTSTNFETAAFVLMDSINHNAELFIKEEEESVLLYNVTPNLYTNSDYRLIEKDHCWTLVHQEKILYTEKK